MSRRRDALLAAATLGLALVAGVVADAPLDPLAAAVGAVGCLGLEWLLARRRAAVRAVWERPTTQAGAVALLVAATALAVELVGTRALTALAAGLATYLVLLAVVVVRDR